MTTHPSQGWAAPTPPPPADRPHRSWRPHWRIMTWVVLAFNVLMLIWLIAGLNAAGDAEDCGAQTGDALRLCQDVNDAGTAVGVWFLIMLWAAGAVILGVIWLVTGSMAKRGTRR
ncbi:hypothetical protein [Streptomyces sp. NPDC052496]|uniref:hypothetical protein n=1 Tax=Streptomyces sp. NPDC052496 TaxID=3154951 RepID=UPI00344A0EB9